MTYCWPDLKLTSLQVGEILAGLLRSSVQSIYVTLHHVFVMFLHLQPTPRVYLVRSKSNERNQSDPNSFPDGSKYHSYII